jgi:AcrR family transcriptional regulator
MPDDQRDPGAVAVAVAVVRRAPFSDNPLVGARGQRTQQRILDAALRAFGDVGYHGASIEKITKLARCSRVSFYQYFASKEDVFRHLAGLVSRQVAASTEALDPLTPDREGWAAMRAWVARFTAIYARYEAVFHALEADPALAAVAGRTGDETVTRIHSRLVTTTLPPRELDPVIRLLLECVNHTLGVAGILRSAAPAAYPSEQVEVTLTDVLHRTFFGLNAGVNAHPPGAPAAPQLEFGAELRELLRQEETHESDAIGSRARAAVLASARDVFVSRGYHNTRVDDLVAAAGVSHGAFYRYFRNKDDLARMLNVRAVQSVGTALLELPDLFQLAGTTGSGVLRQWLRRYHTAHTNEAAMLRVWVDAALADPELRAECAPPLDWGRRRLARYLRPRGFGDDDMDAVVMVALLGVFGTRQRPATEIEAAAHIIERGLLCPTESGAFGGDPGTGR